MIAVGNGSVAMESEKHKQKTLLLVSVLDCVHTMPEHFENGANVTVVKFELAFTRYRNNLKTVGNLMVKTSCKILMAKKCTYTLRIDQSRFKSIKKCSF